MSAFDNELAAEQPLTGVALDQSRRMEIFLKDHALDLWGKLRDIDPLDSKKATEIIKESLSELLAMTKANGRAISFGDRFSRILDCARTLRRALIETWGDKLGTGNMSSQKICRVCGGRNKDHKPTCVVGQALAMSKNVGIATE